MNVSVEINRDIDKFKESVVLGLTAKQLIASVLSILVGGTIVVLTYKKDGIGQHGHTKLQETAHGVFIITTLKKLIFITTQLTQLKINGQL